jgi:hypothetical protein
MQCAKCNAMKKNTMFKEILHTTNKDVQIISTPNNMQPKTKKEKKTKPYHHHKNMENQNK